MTAQWKPEKLPLAYQMAATFGDGRKPSVDEAYKTIRNRLRKFNAASIVELALQLMWKKLPNPLEELRGAPWLTLLIVKWALQDRCVSLSVGPSIPTELFDRVRQELWELQGNVRANQSQTNVFLMLRSLLHVQTEFQRNEGWTFLRWPALYDRLPNQHKSRQQFRAAFGMEPKSFLDLAYGLYAAVLLGKMPFDGDWLSPWRDTYGEDIDRIYTIFVRDLPSLRNELQRESARRIQGRHELFEFPYLKRYPLLRLPDGRLHCWHRLVFARGIEEVVHLRLSEQFGKEYADSFSRVFEDYVTELVADAGVPYLGEATYKRIVGGHAPSVEAILDGDDCNIFVEAKMALFAEDVLLEDSQTAVFQKTKRVRGAIAQGWQVGAYIRQHTELSDRFDKSQDYLLVVTSRELILGGGEMLKRLYAPGALEYPDNNAARRLPLGNVFVLSIEDFEHTMGCVRAGEVNLSTLLREAAVANVKGDTGRMFFGDFLKKHTNRWTHPKVLSVARSDAESRMKAAFGVVE